MPAATRNGNGRGDWSGFDAWDFEYISRRNLMRYALVYVASKFPENKRCRAFLYREYRHAPNRKQIEFPRWAFDVRLLLRDYFRERRNGDPPETGEGFAALAHYGCEAYAAKLFRVDNGERAGRVLARQLQWHHLIERPCVSAPECADCGAEISTRGARCGRCAQLARRERERRVEVERVVSYDALG